MSSFCISASFGAITSLLVLNKIGCPLYDTSSFLIVLWFVSIQQCSRSKCGVVHVRVSIAVYLYLVLEVWEHPEYDAWEPSLGATMPCSLSGGISYVHSSGSFMASRLTLSILRVKVSAFTCPLIRPILYVLYRRHDSWNYDRVEVGNPSNEVNYSMENGANDCCLSMAYWFGCDHIRIQQVPASYQHTPRQWKGILNGGPASFCGALCEYEPRTHSQWTSSWQWIICV